MQRDLRAIDSMTYYYLALGQFPSLLGREDEDARNVAGRGRRDLARACAGPGCRRAEVGGPAGSKCPLLACVVKGGAFQWVQGPPGNPLQPEAIGAVMEVTKWLKPSISVSRIGDSASVQAATRVNAEQSSKRTMRRSTRQPYRGRLIRLGEVSEAVRPDAAPG